MENIYPANPIGVPADYSEPGKSYRQRAWLAMAMLLVFIVLYLFISGWFVWTAWSLLKASFLGGGGGVFWGILAGVVAAFLAVFMLKALFFVNHGGSSDDIEITAAEQPRLFAFLHRLADEAGAPRPHRVFLSARVNAAVFYDLSIFNLLFPSRKNLEIGLGLVNVLNVSEFKAVCAHEFGHFAQRAMAVGRWVYIARQIAGHIVAKRDILDRFLDGLSRSDFRIAWVGWLLRLIVWALRSLLDGAFMLVALAERSLSREMEMQADRVAVSLSGSDALIHALYLLQVADDAWDRTLRFLNGELHDKHAPSDAFALQTEIIKRMGELRNVADYGKVPTIPLANRAQHRLFKAEIAQPPRMWSTHPFNHEREDNAKQIYLPAEEDNRSAWELFDNARTLRETVSADLYNVEDTQRCSVAESITRLDEHFNQESLKRAYRGVYYGRSPVRAAESVAALYGQLEGAAEQITALYPESVSVDLKQLSNLEKEKSLLESLQSGRMTAPGGVVRHRGATLNKRELKQVIAGIEREIKALEARISAHDRLCRTAHRAAASKIGQGWAEYLLGLGGILHYADHTRANLLDADASLGNTIAVETATRRISKNGRKRVIAKAGELFAIIEQVYAQSETLVPDAAVLARMEIHSWAEAMGELELNPPNEDNIGDWLNVVDSWVRHVAGLLDALSDHALEELLVCESKVAACYRAGGMVEPAPAPAHVPAQYPVLLPGQEREIQTDMGWWARFLNADGAIHAVLRFAVAAGIVGVVLSVGSSVGGAKIIVYNGLERVVRVQIGEQKLQLNPHANQQFELTPGKGYEISARTAEGHEIERFQVKMERGFATHVYNIAAASPLIEWVAVYGKDVEAPPDRLLGVPRWSTSSADYVLSEPPRTISTKRGQTPTRSVLSTPKKLTPSQGLKQALPAKDFSEMVKAHARWDAANSPHIAAWLEMASEQNDFSQLIAARLRDNPKDTAALRAQQKAAP